MLCGRKLLKKDLSNFYLKDLCQIYHTVCAIKSFHGKFSHFYTSHNLYIFTKYNQMTSQWTEWLFSSKHVENNYFFLNNKYKSVCTIHIVFIRHRKRIYIFLILFKSVVENFVFNFRIYKIIFYNNIRYKLGKTYLYITK